MALQCGIIGLVNTGKTTIFNCISNTRGETNTFGAAKPNLGMIQVPDKRLYELEKLQPTEKVIHTTFEIVDIPGLTRGSGKGDGNRFLAEIRNTDAIIHVLRCFDDDNVPHADGSVDPVRDIESVDFELQVKDLESVEKKMSRLDKAAKTGDKDARKGLEVLELYKRHLGNFGNARDLKIRDDDRKYVDDLFLLTMKPVLFVCNVDQDSALGGNLHSDAVRKFLGGGDAGMVIIAGALEAEIADLADPADRLEFLRDAGLNEPGVERLVREAYSLLDLRTFFTVGPKEVRAWTIRQGMTAPQAAGVIHSDLERGFIRAEVMKYDDFLKHGSEHACREAGRFFVEGRNYVVSDGDILHIRFNV
ncbi:MAG: redox-regulated ATPase YchF [Bacteroidales bacterium]|jgi:GTP-binding protein YchF|nr:redox-regulated ATPase YchF [Bacteroidales bacterium]